MTFSKWLLIAMVALGVLFTVLLWPRLKMNDQPGTIRMTEALFVAANEIKALRAQRGSVSHEDYQAVIGKLAPMFT